jgi:hypothetical protein
MRTPDMAETALVGRLVRANYAPRIRAERLIASGRVVLAAFSLLAVWLDPSTPAQHAQTTYFLLLAYVGYALLVALVVWLTHVPLVRLGFVTHVVDLLVFSVLTYLTQGPTSPFFTYFMFSIVSATLRWQWRGALDRRRRPVHADRDRFVRRRGARRPRVRAEPVHHPGRLPRGYGGVAGVSRRIRGAAAA